MKTIIEKGREGLWRRIENSPTAMESEDSSKGKTIQIGVDTVGIMDKTW